MCPGVWETRALVEEQLQCVGDFTTPESSTRGSDNSLELLGLYKVLFATISYCLVGRLPFLSSWPVSNASQSINVFFFFFFTVNHTSTASVTSYNNFFFYFLQ